MQHASPVALNACTSAGQSATVSSAGAKTSRPPSPPLGLHWSRAGNPRPARARPPLLMGGAGPLISLYAPIRSVYTEFIGTNSYARENTQ